MLITKKDQLDTLIYAFRYCLGCQTYVTDTMQRILNKAWPTLREEDKEFFKKIIKSYQKMGKLGNKTIDELGWLEFLDKE